MNIFSSFNPEQSKKNTSICWIEQILVVRMYKPLKY